MPVTLSLTIHHNIHLTRAERYALHEGREIVTVGVSVPVWFIDKVTTEPAKEVFCRYRLKNPKEELPIQILDDGYEISVPFREGTRLALSDEEWRYLNLHQPDKLEAMYRSEVQEVSSRNLLDPADGGCVSLIYREHNKLLRPDQTVNIIHCVAIQDLSVLTESLT